LAVEGGGSYAFIPDSGFVGTVFVNALANTLVTVAQPALLTLQPALGARSVRFFTSGCYFCTLLWF
jgi:hypothetical protein